MDTKENENDVIIEEKNDTPVEFEEAPIHEVKTKKQTERTDSYFDGGVLELIGWRLLAFLITVITLGIASPWAQCMLYNWQYKHTVFNGKRLKFEGNGGDLFVNIFKWVFFSIITLGIYIIFIPVKKAKWLTQNLHFEDEELVKNESYFDGNTLQLIGINILCILITFCSFGLLYPFAVCLKTKWVYKHMIVNRKRLVFDGNGLQLWGKSLLWSLLTLVTFGIYLFWLPISVLKWEAKHVHIKKVGEEEVKDKSIYIIIPIVIVIMLIGGLGLFKFFSNHSEEKLEKFTEIITEFIENNRIGKSGSSGFKVLHEDEGIKSIIPEEVLPSELETKPEPKTTPTPEPEPEPVPEQEPAKTSITIGGYTLQLGTYYGQVEQGVWDDTTMTSTSRFYDVYMVLGENTVTLDGRTTGYSTSGTGIYLPGDSYPVLEVTGNNRIMYMAETCPELVYQGY